MGAWGTGSFQNDSALDWYEDFRASGAIAVDAALSATVTEDYIEVDEGSAAIAAAEIVAACFGNAPSDVPSEFDELVSANAPAIRALPDVRQRAVAAVLRVCSGSSELFELWHEDNGAMGREWRVIADNLVKRLEDGQ